MNAQQEVTSSSAELERAIRHKIVERTNGRIRALEVATVGDRIEVRGVAASFHLKQLAIQGSFDAIHSIKGTHVELDVLIRVEPQLPLVEAV